MAARPLVSIITANFNGARFLPAAAQSVFAQSLDAFEWIIADDASSDDSRALIDQIARGDPRVVALPAERNRGPASARNRALAAARGCWIAVFDSDDEMAADRLERLVARGVADAADIVVDNLLVVSEPSGASGRRLLTGASWSVARWISLAAYIDAGRMYARRPGLGYLKPLFRAEALANFRYRETLRIGEDYDLVVRLLARGARMRFEPAALYRYRRHKASISAVLRREHIERMIEADAELGLESPHATREPAARRAQASRRRSLEAALVYDQVIQTLKQRRILAGISQSLRRPDVWPLLMMPILARARRLVPA